MKKVDINDAMKKGLERGEILGLEKGEKLGLEKGINQNKIETAKKMKLKGIDISDIIDITGLTKEEIEKL